MSDYSPSGHRINECASESFHSISAKRLCHTQQMIVDLFVDEEILLTREDIAARTNLKLSSVCGRARSLLDVRVLAVRGSRRCVATGKRQELLGLPVDEQRGLFPSQQ